MAVLSLDWIAAAVGGRRIGGAGDRTVARFGIDSRRIGPGDLFFAVAGRRDGHDFVADAAARGAAAAIVSRPVPATAPGFALILVSDTVAALHALARAVLAERRVKVVAITGSVGKTTTKEFAAALLARRFRVLKTEGNYNNHLGLALSVLRIEDPHEALVLEMGMSGPGEIRALTRIVPPDVAVVTAVGPVHLEFLETVEAVAEAKKEILDGARPGAVAVLNGDDPWVVRIGAGFPGRKILFGRAEGFDIRASEIELLGWDGLRFVLDYGPERRRVRSPFVSEGHLDNFLAALGAAYACGLPLAAIEEAFPTLSPVERRGTVLRLPGPSVLVDDSYNSNPRALEVALRSYGRLPAGRRVAVLGDMLELGAAAAAAHEEAGRQVVRAGWQVLVTVGPLARLAAAAARAAGLAAEAVESFDTSEAAAERLVALLRPGDVVLVKGSRGVGTDRIADRVRDAFRE